MYSDQFTGRFTPSWGDGAKRQDTVLAQPSDSAARFLAGHSDAAAPASPPAQMKALGGYNLILGDAGNNTLQGTAGADLMLGLAGQDIFTPGAGSDLMIGGRDGDLYVISASDTEGDIIREMGSAPNINGYYSTNIDEIRLAGYASLAEAMHAIDLSISGKDLVLTYVDPQAPAVTGSVTVQKFFSGNRSGIEAVSFDLGTSVPLFHVSKLSGDDYTYSVHSGPDQGGEDIVVGTNGGDEIYGGIGTDILFGGLGADNFMFHDEVDSNGATDIILDFDIAQDKLDYSDIGTLTFADITVTDSALGHALVGTVYGSIELIGVTSAEVTAGIFTFV